LLFCLKSENKTLSHTQQGSEEKDGQCERRSRTEFSERIAEDRHPVITLRVSAGGILYPAPSCDAEKIQLLFSMRASHQ